jgi:tRNA(Arg) A34 adenosine deaminase TadA
LKGDLMKKFFVLILFLATMGAACASEFSKCDKNADLKFANKVMLDIQKQVGCQIEKGYGPFLAAIYDKNGKLIAQMPNTVIQDQCSLNHAEVNTIREAQKVLGTYDLSKYDLTLYTSSEPCIMCTGAIMWSGIRHVYYGVSSKDVEAITGFDEGYKPDWQEQFRLRHIDVIGGIQETEGKIALSKYVKSGKHVYKPGR